MSKLHYANGNEEMPKELWDKGDALIIYVNEGDFWNLMIEHGIELVKIGGERQQMDVPSADLLDNA